MGRILAECLDDLPHIESIDVSGNSLTDDSLPLLFKSFQKIPNLKHLNLSRSKIDDATSDALAEFLANPDCPLTSLVLQKADIDDFECARFILCLKTNKKLKELDLSGNLLGSAEIFQGAKSETFHAGGKSIAEFIASSDCRLSSLKLGWNSIKMSSSIDIAKALSLNQTLMYLDLSYNGLGELAGQYLGDSLQTNKTLHTLLLDNNQLNGVATFCICVGLQNNETLRKISLDKNPIGEFGAKAIIQVPESVGQRCSLSAVGCNIKLREANSIFKFDDLVRDYSLNLEKPFDRTVARWLLEKVAAHNSLVISKIAYESANGKQTPINLILVAMPEDESYELMDENNKHLIDGYRRLLAATEDLEHAERVFVDADLDANDKLDKEELTLCLEDLGYPMEPETVDDIFAEFDLDFSGTLEREEFFYFLQSKVDETKARISEILEQYYYALAEKPKEMFTPPKAGTLVFTVVNQFTDKGPKNVVTAIQQRYAFEQAVKTGDSNLISEFIQHTRLRYNEALKVYKAINAETGNMSTALSKVLVRMLNTADARALLAKVTNNESMKVTRVKQALSNAYNPLLGNVNGYYCLNLSQEMDRLCLTQLLEHSKIVNARRYKDLSFGCLDGKLGDTSQNGNWTCFRNASLNKEPFLITSAAFIPMKTTGILEFDFSRYYLHIYINIYILLYILLIYYYIYYYCSVDRPPFDALPINDFRLCRILHHITLVPKDDLYKALSILGELKDITVYAETHFAHVIYETPLEKAKSIGMNQEFIYNNLLTRGAELELALKREIVMTDVKHEQYTRRMSRMGSSFSKSKSKMGSSFASRSSHNKSWKSAPSPTHNNNHASLPSPSPSHHAGNHSSRQNSSRRAEKDVGFVESEDDAKSIGSGSGSANSKRMNRLKSIRRLPGEDYDYEAALEAKDLEVLPPHITEIKQRFTDLLNNTGVSDSAKAYRIYEVYCDLFSKVYLRCRHLVLMIKYFKFGATSRVTKYGSYFLELVIFMYPRIVDLHNFEIVLNELTAEDCAALYCRIGWLNIFNPCKVDGGFELQLARREERIVVKMLVTLSIDEPCQNIMNQEFQWERSDPPIPGWDLTEGWKTAEGIPVRGILRLDFTSYGSKKEPVIPSAIIESTAALTALAALTQNAPTVTINTEGLNNDKRDTVIASRGSQRAVIVPTTYPKFVDVASFTNSKRQYRVNNDLRRCLTFVNLIDDEACLKCETEKETRLAMLTSKKGVDIRESARARKSLWQFLYPQ